MKRMTDIIWLESTDSTNSEAARKMDVIDNMAVIAARNQTKGRGQRGNVWQSETGVNLTFSIAIKPGKEGIPVIGAKSQFVICECITLAIKAVLSSCEITAKIKWPNDIYVNDRKICGILIENTLRGSDVASSIIGVGLNVNQIVFPEDLPNPTSMKIEAGHDYNVEKVLENIVGEFCKYVEMAADASGREDMREMYLADLYRKGEWHHYDLPIEGRKFRGMIRGISGIGNLLVEDEQGRYREYGFKEIGYVIKE
ncbi:MAG: biotin--[acetyl-CoA-carboxylase] ligase [Candidatus Cryptobacteroides sp.]